MCNTAPREKDRQILIPVPPGSLIVLCGVAGSGKSSFAGKHFSATQVISSDECRAILSDDPANQRVSGKAFELMHWIITERLRFKRTTVVDSTALTPRARKQLLKIAETQNASAIVICFNISLETCLDRDRQRARSVGPQVVHSQYATLERALEAIRTEPWDQVVILTEQDVDKVKFVRRLGSFDLRQLTGPFDIIGDLHGCTDELKDLLALLGYAPGEDGVYRHPEGRTLVFLGDLGDRGPHDAEGFAIAMKQQAARTGLYSPGNHCNKLMRYLQGRRVQLTNGLDVTVEQVEARDREQPGFKEELQQFIETAPPYLWLDGGQLVVAHAGIKEDMIGTNNASVRTMCLYGDITGRTNPDGTPERLDWAKDYHGSAAVVYGHTPRADATWVNNTINVDQGCVYGGKLTALRWPERQLVQVPARQMYDASKGTSLS